MAGIIASVVDGQAHVGVAVERVSAMMDVREAHHGHEPLGIGAMMRLIEADHKLKGAVAFSGACRLFRSCH